MKKPKLIVLIVLGIVVAALIAIYAFGLYRGHVDASEVIASDGLPFWQVMGDDTSSDLAAAPNRYMSRFVHDEKWSVYRYGYNTGYNRLAFHWSKNALQGFQKAAKKENPRAQFVLGEMYFKGDGVDQDKTEGIKWYRSSAEKGYVRSEFELGYIYNTGAGVDEDNKEAVKWYLKAAKKGWPWAQNNLGRMYWNGDGVKQDEVEGLAWFILAETRGIAKVPDVIKALDSYPSIRAKAELRAKQISDEIKKSD